VDEAYNLLPDSATYQPINTGTTRKVMSLANLKAPRYTQVRLIPRPHFTNQNDNFTLGLVHDPCLNHLLEHAEVGADINAGQSSTGAYSNVAQKFHSLVIEQRRKPQSDHNIYGPKPGIWIRKGMQRSRIPSTLERGISLGRRKGLEWQEGRVCGSGIEAICACIWIWSGSTGLAAAES